MLTFFFILVFLAEIKFAADLVLLINKCDKKVCALNECLITVNPKITKTFTPLRIAINTTLLNINKAKIKIAEKKDEYKFIILKNIITTAIFLALNINGKRAITIVELAFSLKDISKKVLKLTHSFKK